MLNFSTPLDNVKSRRLVVTVDTPSVEASVEITPAATHAPSQQASYLTKTEDNWDWRNLRDYVVREIEARFGVFPRDVIKESSIFKSFIDRWQGKAPLIAKAAFEVHDGVWRGAPMNVNRFTKNSDPYFAEVIVSNMRVS
jgi:hypothetical protein